MTEAGPYCQYCGSPAPAAAHPSCQRAATLEPPRYCRSCRRRMVVQVLPTGWTARCVEHGTISATTSDEVSTPA